MSKLYVGNIPSNLNESMISDIFKDYDSVKLLNVKRTGVKVFAFLQCNDENQKEMLISEINNKEVSGRKLIIREFKDNSENNRSKESPKSRANDSKDTPPPLIPITRNEKSFYEDKNVRNSDEVYSKECLPIEDHSQGNDRPPKLIPIKPHTSSSNVKTAYFYKNNLTENSQKSLNSGYDDEEEKFFLTEDNSNSSIKKQGGKKNQSPNDKIPNLSHPFLNKDLLYLSIMNFPFGTTRGQLYDLVGDFEPRRIYMVYDSPNEINHTTLAFVSFDDQNDVTNAILELDNTQYRRRILRVEDVDIDYVAEVLSYKQFN